MRDLVDLLLEKISARCKQIYKIKTWSDGSIKRYKAHPITKRFTQEYSIDYEETFIPVVQLTFVRTFLAIVVVKYWQLFQMDVKNIFFNDDLQEKVYM